MFSACKPIRATFFFSEIFMFLARNGCCNFAFFFASCVVFTPRNLKCRSVIYNRCNNFRLRDTSGWLVVVRVPNCMCQSSVKTSRMHPKRMPIEGMPLRIQNQNAQSKWYSCINGIATTIRHQGSIIFVIGRLLANRSTNLYVWNQHARLACGCMQSCPFAYFWGGGKRLFDRPISCYKKRQNHAFGNVSRNMYVHTSMWCAQRKFQKAVVSYQ